MYGLLEIIRYLTRTRCCQIQNCDKVTYEKEGHVHGVFYTDENDSAGWTPVVGREKKRCRLPEVFLCRFSPDTRLRHANQSGSSDVL